MQRRSFGANEKPGALNFVILSLIYAIRHEQFFAAGIVNINDDPQIESIIQAHGTIDTIGPQVDMASPGADLAAANDRH